METPSRVRRLRVARLMGFVALFALVLRGCVVPDARWTVRVVNVGRNPLRDVVLRQGGRVLMRVAEVAPGRSAELRLRNPSPAPGVLEYRSEAGAAATKARFNVGPRRGPTRVESEYRIGDRGLAGTSFSREPDPFGCAD